MSTEEMEMDHDEELAMDLEEAAGVMSGSPFAEMFGGDEALYAHLVRHLTREQAVRMMGALEAEKFDDMLPMLDPDDCPRCRARRDAERLGRELV